MGQAVTGATFFLFIPAFHSLTSIRLRKMRKRDRGRCLPYWPFTHSIVVYARLQILMLSLSQKPGPTSLDTQLIRPASNLQDKFMVPQRACLRDSWHRLGHMVRNLPSMCLKSKAGELPLSWELKGAEGSSPPFRGLHSSCLGPWCCVSPDILDSEALSPLNHTVLSVVECPNSPNAVTLRLHHGCG